MTQAPQLASPYHSDNPMLDARSSSTTIINGDVGIIGGGPGGIITAVNLMEKGLRCTIIEQASSFGGVWANPKQPSDTALSTSPSPNDQVDAPPVLYAGLHTNLPLDVMGIPYYPFIDSDFQGHQQQEQQAVGEMTTLAELPCDQKRFAHHPVIRRYTQRYAAEHKLRDITLFGMQVVNVQRCAAEELESKDKAADDVSMTHEHSSGSNSSSCSNQSRGETRWRVLMQPTHSDKNPTKRLQYSFRFLVIASGHYNKPSALPEAFKKAVQHQGEWSDEGRDQRQPTRLQNRILHSVHYNSPKEFDGKRLLIVGDGPSGMDIMREVLQQGHPSVLGWCLGRQKMLKKISGAHPSLPDQYTDRVVLHPYATAAALVTAEGSTATDVSEKQSETAVQVTFNDESSAVYDVVICATGFDFHFPFLEESQAPQEHGGHTSRSMHALIRERKAVKEREEIINEAEDEHDIQIRMIHNRKCLSGLYEHLFCIQDNSLAFVGLPYMIAPFPLMYAQAKLLAAVWSCNAHPSQTRCPEASQESQVTAPSAPVSLNTTVLPSKSEQWEWEREEWHRQKAQFGRESHFHRFAGEKLWSYNDRLLGMAGLGPLPPSMRARYFETMAMNRLLFVPSVSTW